MTEEIEAIERVRERYFRLVDEADWDGWRRLFTDDATLDVDGIVRGPDELTSLTRAALAGGTSLHRWSEPRIEITGPDTARGVWVMEDHLRFADGTGLRGSGHYRDGYRRVRGEWLICETVLVRERLERLGGD